MEYILQNQFLLPTLAEKAPSLGAGFLTSFNSYIFSLIPAIVTTGSLVFQAKEYQLANSCVFLQDYSSGIEYL